MTDYAQIARDADAAAQAVRAALGHARMSLTDAPNSDADPHGRITARQLSRLELAGDGCELIAARARHAAEREQKGG